MHTFDIRFDSILRRFFQDEIKFRVVTTCISLLIGSMNTLKYELFMYIILIAMCLTILLMYLLKRVFKMADSAAPTGDLAYVRHQNIYWSLLKWFLYELLYDILRVTYVGAAFEVQI